MSASATEGQKALFSTCRRLRKEGRSDQAGALLADALRRYRIDTAGILHAGNMLQKIHRDTGTDCGTEVTILGQCTTSWLVPALVAVARGRDYRLQVDEADYDNVVQGLHQLGPATQSIILLPWAQRLLGNSNRGAAQKAEDELEFWQNVWAMAAKRGDLHIVQVGYDWVDAGSDGHLQAASDGGAIDLVRQANMLLRENLPAGAYFVDLEQVSGTIGRQRFYDQRSYYWTRQPFSDEGVVSLAEHLWSGLRAATTGPKKVLVLDLDNTLWGGVVGETGPLAIELGDSPAGNAFRDFQRLARSLAERGTLIAICSKNNPQDAREPFEKNPDMVLRLDDIAVFKAGWTPKAEVIQEVARQLRLGLDSFVFFDDEPAERELIRQALPEVEVVDVPEDPADFRQALLSGLWFESTGLSTEDRLRTQQYQVEQQRENSRSSLNSVKDYLLSLEMTADVNGIDATTMDRVIQLLGKTNQFNLTTRRHTSDTVAGMLAQAGTVGVTLHVRDRFGDYGLVGVIIAVRESPEDTSTLRIDTWLMSCRVIGRTAEQFFFNALVDRISAEGCTRLIGEFIPTKKNSVVAKLYEGLGFKPRSANHAASRYHLDLNDYQVAATFVAGANTDK